MLLRFVPLIALLCSTPVAAQNYYREDVVRGLCQKDGCDEFVVLDKKAVTERPEGTLFRTRVRTYHASYQGRVDQGEEDGFVFCSPVKPAIIATTDGQPPVAVLLAPFARAPAYIERQTTNFYALYFAMCHGIDAGKAAARDRQAVASSFNYRVPLAQSKNVTLKKVEDILDLQQGG